MMSNQLTILVTGANGQLGTAIKQYAKNEKFNFFYTDIDQLNLLDFEALSAKIEEIKPNIIVNCAAYTAVDMAENDQDMAMSVNVDVVKNLGAIASKNNIKIIHISTDYVFDGRTFLPYTEEDATNPISVYGYTKLSGEKALFASGCDGIIIRTSWLYSSYGNNFFNTICRIAKSQPEISIVFDQIGTPTFAGDLAHTILQIIPQMLTISGVDTYHYSNEGVCSWFDFAVEIIALKGYDTKVYPIHSQEYPTLAQRPYYSVLDKSKIKNAFGLAINQWRVSLKACVAEASK